MQQIRIVDYDAARIPDTENMRLMLSEHPDQTWIARLRHLAATSEEGRALKLRVEDRSLVFACADQAQRWKCRMLIGALVDQTNAPDSGGSPKP